MVVIAASLAATACRTAGTPVENKRVLTSQEPSTKETGGTDAGCGPQSKPLFAGELPRVEGVDADDVQTISALMRRRTKMPLAKVAVGSDSAVDAWAGCCSAVAGDCSLFRARLGKKDGHWIIVRSSEIVE